MSSPVHVAVGVIEQDGKVLLALRPDHVHQGGLWEFPGGKVEASEDVREALARELAEELGIRVPVSDTALQPLIRIRHSYSDKSVLLDVWKVSSFEGDPYGKEGQKVRWMAVDELDSLPFPDANKPIIKACQSPRQLVITPRFDCFDTFQSYLHNFAGESKQLLMLRQPQLSIAVYKGWVDAAVEIIDQSNTKMILHGDPEKLEAFPVLAVHMPASVGLSYQHRNAKQQLLSMSCHDLTELRHAQGLGLDFVTLSPVKPTSSHPDAKPMGWDVFESLCEPASVPVYALGGLSGNDLTEAMARGAQGVAGISGWHHLD